MQRSIGVEGAVVEAIEGIIVICVAAALVVRKPSADGGWLKHLLPQKNKPAGGVGMFGLDTTLISDVLASSVRLGTPIAFAALGGVFAERSGTYNVALEGGMLTGLLLGGLVIRLRVNQLVAGLAVNILVGGLTAFGARLVFGDMVGGARVAGFSTFEIPVLSSLPIIGDALFAQDPLFYLLILLGGLSWWWMFRSNAGLDFRAVGENPRAADVAGVPVFRFKYVALAISGAMAALGGMHLVLSQVYVFTEGMSAGKGFIALAAIILGRWSPAGAIAAALLFGFFDAVQFKLQFSNPEVPYQLFLILPYVASLAALIFLVGKTRAPASVGRKRLFSP
jgi:simple sugar transport system permease protein